MPGMGGTQTLPRIIGTKIAMKMILTGEPIPASEAERLNVCHLIKGDQYEEKLTAFMEVLLNKAS